MLLGLTKDSVPSVSQLIRNLLDNYDPSIRPVYNTSESTRMDVDLALQQVIEVVRQIAWTISGSQIVGLTFNFDFYSEWKATDSQGNDMAQIRKLIQSSEWESWLYTGRFHVITDDTAELKPGWYWTHPQPEMMYWTGKLQQHILPLLLFSIPIILMYDDSRSKAILIIAADEVSHHRKIVLVSVLARRVPAVGSWELQQHSMAQLIPWEIVATWPLSIWSVSHHKSGHKESYISPYKS